MSDIVRSPGRPRGSEDREARVVKHGFFVRASSGLRLRDKKVERLARKMRGFVPWLEESDVPTCRAWAELETLAVEVYAALRTVGVLNAEGDASRLLDDYRKLRQTQVVLSRELALIRN